MPIHRPRRSGSMPVLPTCLTSPHSAQSLVTQCCSPSESPCATRQRHHQHQLAAKGTVPLPGIVPSLLDSLQSALQQAKAAGYDLGDIRRAESLVKQEQVREELASAIHKRKPTALRNALEKARRTRGIEKSELEGASKLLAQLEATDLVTESLRENDMGMLRTAIVRAKSAGIDQNSIEQAELILKQTKARELLKSATELRRADLLKLALREVKDAQLPDAELAAAKELLQELQASRGRQPQPQQHQTLSGTLRPDTAPNMAGCKTSTSMSGLSSSSSGPRLIRQRSTPTLNRRSTKSSLHSVTLKPLGSPAGSQGSPHHSEGSEDDSKDQEERGQ